MGQLKHKPRCKILYVLFSERASHIISYCLCPCVMYEHLVLNRCFSIIFRMSVLPRMGCIFVTGRRRPRGGLVAAGASGPSDRRPLKLLVAAGLSRSPGCTMRRRRGKALGSLLASSLNRKSNCKQDCLLKQEARACVSNAFVIEDSTFKWCFSVVEDEQVTEEADMLMWI